MFTSIFVVHAQNPVVLTQGYENEFELSGDQLDVFSITLPKGGFLEMNVLQKGIDVIIDVYHPSGKLLQSFDSPTGNSGYESVYFVPVVSGLYRIEIHRFNDPFENVDLQYEFPEQGKYLINKVKVLSSADYRKKLQDDREKDEKIVDALTNYVMPFNTVVAGNGFEDLQPLKEILKDVKYIGLGEATHGTREFFQMKHRLLEFLVKEMGFSVFAMEASFPGCQNINNYVMYGNGDAYTALASQGFWTWNTEEVIDMIEWIRSYNQSVAEEKKIKFAGIDIQCNKDGGSIAKMKTYLQKVDSIRFKEMSVLLDSIELMIYSPSVKAIKDSIHSSFLNFLSFFTMSKGYYVQRSSLEEYESMLDYCRVLVQLVDYSMIPSKISRSKEREWRDYYMANNFFDMVTHEKSDAKYIIWAHNGHIAFDAGELINTGFRSLGCYLKEAYGNQYFSLGFTFNKGSFQAMEYDTAGHRMGLQEFTVAEARKGSFDWYMAQVKFPNFIFSFRNDAVQNTFKDIIDTPIGTRSFGATAQRNTLNSSFYLLNFNKNYDGIIFINETHRADPVKSTVVTSN